MEFLSDLVLNSGTVIEVNFPNGAYAMDIISDENHAQLEEIVQDIFQVEFCFETGIDIC